MLAERWVAVAGWLLRFSLVTVPAFCTLAFGLTVVPVDPFLASWVVAEPLLRFPLSVSFTFVSPLDPLGCVARTSEVDEPSRRASFMVVPVLPEEIPFSSLATDDLISPRDVLPDVPTDPR